MSAFRLMSFSNGFTRQQSLRSCIDEGSTSISLKSSFRFHCSIRLRLMLCELSSLELLDGTAVDRFWSPGSAPSFSKLPSSEPNGFVTDSSICSSDKSLFRFGGCDKIGPLSLIITSASIEATSLLCSAAFSLSNELTAWAQDILPR